MDIPPTFNRIFEVSQKPNQRRRIADVDYEGKAVGDRRVVFFNTKDQSWQAIAGDGQGVIIINEVTKDRADKIYNRIGRFQAEPQKLSLEQIEFAGGRVIACRACW